MATRPLAGSQDGSLPASARDALKGYLQLLDHLRLQIARVTRTFRRQVQADPSALRLCTLPGVQWILGYTLLADTGRIERFPSARHLVSNSLLAPRADDSGDDEDGSPRGRHVGHCGQSKLKWAYIEAADASPDGWLGRRSPSSGAPDGHGRSRRWLLLLSPRESTGGTGERVDGRRP